METPLLQTKLYIPPPRRDLVHRPHLIQRLNEGLEFDRQIALVSAPAGFGKTTCISEWVGAQRAAPLPSAAPLPVTWLSLEPADDDPGHFFTYLIAALQKVDANLPQPLHLVLLTREEPPLPLARRRATSGGRSPFCAKTRILV